MRDAVASAKPVDELIGQPERLRVVYPDCGHDFPQAQRQAAYAFLDECSRPSR